MPKKVRRRRLTSLRIELPRGIYYDILSAGAKLHGAPSLSKYILNAAMTYTQTYLENKKNELDKRKESDLHLRDTPSDEFREDDSSERQAEGTGSGHGIVSGSGESGD